MKTQKNSLSPSSDHNVINKNDIISTVGIDTLIPDRSKMATTSIDRNKRTVFFADRTNIKNLLLREETNPLVEEGKISQDNRQHEGELYLTHEALTLLIEKKIRSHKKKKTGLFYNSKNIFVVKNNSENLQSILQNLNLADGEDAKFIYISGVDAVPFYMHCEGDKIQCFIVDSKARPHHWPTDIINAIKNVFPDATITLSSVLLQKDHDNSSTFAFKVLQYFVKHGREVFPYINRVETSKLDKGCQLIADQDLMPALLKMCQSKLFLSDATLNSIVCHKKKMTLRNYYSLYTIPLDGKQKNAAALVKKYHYFDELNSYITERLNDETINPSNKVDLPKALNERHRHFSKFKKKQQKKNASKNYIYLNTLTQVVNLLKKPSNPYQENDDDPAKKLYADIIHRNLDDNLLVKFPELYNSNNENTNKEEEKRKLDQLMLVACCQENKFITYFYLHLSDNLWQLFGNYKDAFNYLQKHANCNAKQPIHDACIFDFPENRESWQSERKFWAKLVLKYGQPAARFLSLAPEITQKLLEIKKSNPNYAQSFKNELALVKHIASLITYQRATENKDLAELCFQFNKSESKFNRCLDILHKGKSFDLLPDVNIKGKDIDKKLARFRFVKLPVDDVRGLFLGEYTSCCQSVGNVGGDCAIHGMTSIYGGFYVVYDKKNQIIAQTWAWVGKNRELVFDSWEYINPDQSYLCKPFLEKAAEKILKKGYKRVLLGTGGNTPNEIFPEGKIPAHPRAYDRDKYRDSDRQYLINKSSDNPTSDADLFALFTKEHPGLLNKSHHLLKLMSDPEKFTHALNQLITTHHLSFDEFICLVKYFYHIGYEFLHCINKHSDIFMQNIIQRYQYKVKCLLFVPDVKGVSLIELLANASCMHSLEAFVGIIEKSQLTSLLLWLLPYISLENFKHLQNVFLSHLKDNCAVEKIKKLSNEDLKKYFSKLLGFAVMMNNLNLLTYLHQVCANEDKWNKQIRNFSSSSGNLLYVAIQSGSLNTLLYLLDTVNIYGLDVLLMQNLESSFFTRKTPLEGLVNKFSIQEGSQIIEKIMWRYHNSSIYEEKLPCSTFYYLCTDLILNNQIDLYDKMLNLAKKYNCFSILMSYSNSILRRNTNSINDNKSLDGVIRILMKHCSSDQKKYLLNHFSTYVWDLDVKVLKLLLDELDTVDGDTFPFRRIWLKHVYSSNLPAMSFESKENIYKLAYTLLMYSWSNYGIDKSNKMRPCTSLALLDQMLDSYTKNYSIIDLFTRHDFINHPGMNFNVDVIHIILKHCQKGERQQLLQIFTDRCSSQDADSLVKMSEMITDLNQLDLLLQLKLDVNSLANNAQLPLTLFAKNLQTTSIQSLKTILSDVDENYLLDFDHRERYNDAKIKRHTASDLKGVLQNVIKFLDDYAPQSPTRQPSLSGTQMEEALYEKYYEQLNQLVKVKNNLRM